MSKYTSAEWIDKAEEKYPNRFDYTNTVYLGSYHKVQIKCIKHNLDFECSPVQFLRTTCKGNLCPKCHTNKKMTSADFLEKAKFNYGNLYDFTKVDYHRARELVTLGCQSHGDFQVAARYVSSNDSKELCPKCRQLTNNLGHGDYLIRYTNNKELGAQPGIFYKLIFTHLVTGIKFIKVGITSKTIEERYSSKQYSDFSYDILEAVHTTNIESAKMERRYIKDNIDSRFYLPKGMWFEGRTECFTYSEDYQLETKHLHFVRDSLLLKQDGLCALCGKVPKIPVVDHWHTKRNYGNGKVRGVLCSTCNTMVAVIENNLTRKGIDYSDACDWLRSASYFLESPTTNLIHPTEKQVVKITRTQFKKLMVMYLEKYPKRKPLKYPKTGKASERLKEVIKEFNI